MADIGTTWAGAVSTRDERANALAVAAGHELNNELTVIMGCVSNAMLATQPADPIRSQLLEISGAAQRCAWMAESLLKFAARRGTHPRPLTVEDIVELDLLL